MVSLTINLEDPLKKRMDKFTWVNWSNVGSHATYKRYIFEKYLQTRTISQEDNLFCESIDWHPVDELAIKESFSKKVHDAQKEKPIKLHNVSELFS